MKVLNFLNEIKIVPRWIIFLFDLSIVAIAFLLTYLIHYNFNIGVFLKSQFALEMLYCLGVTTISFFIFQLYTGIIRYTSAIDSIRILSTILFTVIVLFSAKLVFIAFQIPSILATNVIILYALFSFTLLIVYRTTIKIFFQFTNPTRKFKKNILVYGAGDLGIAVKRTFDNDFQSTRAIVAYLDDDDSKVGKSIDGVKIYETTQLRKLIKILSVDELIIASDTIELENKNDAIDICLEYNVNVLTLPPVQQIMNGDFTSQQLKKIRIEDLLERSPIVISNEQISDQIKGKRILITGAAGSIGSEISEQIGKYSPQMIILCDQAESPLHNLQLDLQDKFQSQTYHTFIADVKNEKRMRLLFETFKPHIVFHAAAYKHVPIIENHPVEGVRTNVLGTHTVANLAVEFNAQKFVFVSTDKAVNPTNVMGATKRIAEIYVQALNNFIAKTKNTQTRFITTRFGNVLGSNGSVIPRFKDQIEKGGPLTVTHPEITRYFMTIPEACQLVIEAGSMGNGGEIFVFDMGKSVKIVDLAEKMIKLSGSTPYKDIDIKFTGLRPGEKLYEELLNDLENTLPTHHHKIMIAQIRENDFNSVSKELELLFEICDTGDSNDLVRQMKIIVPEFISKNSVFEQLDREKRDKTLKISS